MILVTGATGSIGRALVHELTLPFTAFVRSESGGRDLGCPFMVGDFDDPESVTAAMKGIDALFLNAAGAQPVDGEQPMVAQQKRVIDAARDAGVRYIVKISVLGAAAGGLLATGAHWAIEQHLKASGIDWTILHPNGFMQNFQTGAGLLSQDGTLIGAVGDAKVSYIDAADIAACAAALFTRPRPGETLVLTGPEALSTTEIAGKLTAARGKPVTYTAVTATEMAEAIKAQGLPPQFAEDVATLWAQVSDGSLAPVTTTVQDITGRPPRTFDAYLAALPRA